MSEVIGRDEEANKKAYDELAEEYATRDYAVQDEFYKTHLFADLGFEKGKRILEIGPGRGAWLKNFLEYGMDVTATLLSSEMCNLCASIAPETRIINKNVLVCGNIYTKKESGLICEKVN